MRQIKFRGLAPYTGWEYGSLITTETGEAFIIPDYVKNEDEIHSEIQGVDPETVGQFTGLQDKNGKDIYEGEYLSNNYQTDKEVIREVKFDKGKWVLVRIKGNSTIPKIVSLYDFYRLNYEVIGNIHENEDLL